MISKFFDVYRDRFVQVINDASDVTIVSHLDADGITSASIMAKTMERCGIEYRTIFARQLEDVNPDDLDGDTVIYTDMGSGYIDWVMATKRRSVIVDHHQPAIQKMEMNGVVQINPHILGFSGATDISGSGMSFITAMMTGRDITDAAPLAVVGAVGDMQDSRHGRLGGLNREIVAICEENGLLISETDIKLFGRQTRPVPKMLEYTTDPFIPGLSGSEEGSTDFVKRTLSRYEIGWRWIDLPPVERSQMLIGLIEHCRRYGIPQRRLIGEVYTLLNEPTGTELRDAKEFATLLNATARYNKPDIGLKICLGDRDAAFEEARIMLQTHRQNLAKGVKYVQDTGITPLSNIQYFDAGDEIIDSIVGIVAGMVFSCADRSKPIFAIAKSPNGVKISARATWDQVNSGVNLAEVMRRASEQVGGRGGGHSIAAGATIPDGTTMKFLEIANEIVGTQRQK